MNADATSVRGPFGLSVLLKRAYLEMERECWGRGRKASTGAVSARNTRSSKRISIQIVASVLVTSDRTRKETRGGEVLDLGERANSSPARSLGGHLM